METKAELIRTKGNVFVDIRNPNEVSPVTPIEALYSDWTDWTEVAKEIATDVSAEAPVIETCRVVKVSDGKRKQVYEGELTQDIIDRCQAYANRKKCTIELHIAEDCQIFKPEVPADCPMPIGDTLKAPDIAKVYDDDCGDLLWEGVKQAGFDTHWQAYANEYEITVRATWGDRGHYTKYFVPNSVQSAYMHENAEKANPRPTEENGNRLSALEVLEYATEELTAANLKASTLLVDFGLDVENAELDGLQPPTALTDPQRKKLKAAASSAQEAFKLLEALEAQHE